MNCIGFGYNRKKTSIFYSFYNKVFNFVNSLDNLDVDNIDTNKLKSSVKILKNSIIKKRIKQLQKNKKLWKSISIKQN